MPVGGWARIRFPGVLFGAVAASTLGTGGRLAGRRSESAGGAEARMAGRASDRIAEEQAALRRVATLVARAAPAEEVFAAVTAEVGRVLPADLVSMLRYDPDGASRVVGAWAGAGVPPHVPVGLRVERGGQNLNNLNSIVFQTGRPARTDYDEVTGPVADLAHELGIRSGVGAPVSVEGHLWGFVGVSSRRE